MTAKLLEVLDSSTTRLRSCASSQPWPWIGKMKGSGAQPVFALWARHQRLGERDDRRLLAYGCHLGGVVSAALHQAGQSMGRVADILYAGKIIE